MEEILKLLDDHYILKLDERGNVEEIISFYDDSIFHEPFIEMVSDDDKKKAAKIFLDALENNYGKGIIRLRRGEEYSIFDVKMVKSNDIILLLAREIGREKPSFIADLLGNVVEASDEWETLLNQNLFDVVEGKEKLLAAVREAVEKGEYDGNAFINEKEVRFRIKATTHLEFFVEEDIYRLLEKIMDAGNAKEIFNSIQEAMHMVAEDFYIRLFDMEAGTRKEAVYRYPILRRGEVVGEILLYEDMDENDLTMVKMISFLSSKATERIKEVYNILNDFAFYKIDREGNIIYVNPKFEKLTGFRENEVRGVNLKEISERGDDFFRLLERKGKVENYISRWKGKKGGIIARERAWKINGETLVIMEDITREMENEREIEFYNSLLRHDIFNKNEIALGYMGLMEKTNLTKKQRDFLDKIKTSLKEANELIEKVRKAETIRKMEGKTKPVNIGKVINSICQKWTDEVRKQGINLSCRAGNVSVEADDFLAEIFNNLIENSLQHSGCKNIVIKGRKEEDFYVIQYEDDGIGIEEKYLDRIFDEGWKMNSSGSGLGLYMVKKLMVRYGGKVEAERAESGGLRINLYFKMARKGKKQDILKMRI